jgi:hypothetical protein
LVQHIDSSGLDGKVPRTDDLDVRLERICSRFLQLENAADVHLSQGHDARKIVGRLDGR